MAPAPNSASARIEDWLRLQTELHDLSTEDRKFLPQMVLEHLQKLASSNADYLEEQVVPKYKNRAEILRQQRDDVQENLKKCATACRDVKRLIVRGAILKAVTQAVDLLKLYRKHAEQHSDKAFREHDRMIVTHSYEAEKEMQIGAALALEVKVVAEIIDQLETLGTEYEVASSQNGEKSG